MKINNLYYYDNNKWVPFPGWCYFFYDLGYYIASKTNEGVRYVAGISIPTRAFAASMVATGIVLAGVEKTGLVTRQSYFEKLSKLPKGTKLVFKEGNRFKYGIFEGTVKLEHFNGKTGLRILDPGSDDNLANIKHINNIDEVFIARNQQIEIPARQIGRIINFNRRLIDNLLLEKDSSSFFLNSMTQCLILGRISYLKEEILDTIIGVKKNSYIRGTLQDILRVRRFLHEDEPFKTEIYPERNDAPEDIFYDAPVVIFDGSTSFLKWRDYYRNSHWIVLLDRTEPSFDQGKAHFNMEYIQNRLDDKVDFNCQEIPPGVELVVYKEACR